MTFKTSIKQVKFLHLAEVLCGWDGFSRADSAKRRDLHLQAVWQKKIALNFQKQLYICSLIFSRGRRFGFNDKSIHLVYTYYISAYCMIVALPFRAVVPMKFRDAATGLAIEACPGRFGAKNLEP